MMFLAFLPRKPDPAVSWAAAKSRFRRDVKIRPNGTDRKLA